MRSMDAREHLYQTSIKESGRLTKNRKLLSKVLSGPLSLIIFKGLAGWRRLSLLSVCLAFCLSNEQGLLFFFKRRYLLTCMIWSLPKLIKLILHSAS